jgi:vacuolar protein sorting-associated protein 13D
MLPGIKIQNGAQIKIYFLLLIRTKFILQMLKSSGIQITISAPFWLINRTGLPLIFRQEGVPYESAGQFSENEQARQVSPFMYSFSDPDGSPALIVRLGKRYGINPSVSYIYLW